MSGDRKGIRMRADSYEMPVHAEAAAYSFGNQAYGRDPFSLWERFRETPGLLRSAEDSGFWILSRYEEVRQAATQENRFCARFGRHTKPNPGVLLPSDADGADHRKYRRLLTPWMTAEAMKPVESQCRATCAEMLTPLSKRTTFDIAQEYATPAVVMMGIKWLGWPAEDAEHLGKWAHDIMAPALEGDTSDAGNWRRENRESSWQELSEYITRKLEDRRSSEPRDDIIQTI